MPVPRFDLSQHFQFIKELARRKVRDEDEAEEVAQITAEKALRSPPLDSRNPRGWIFRVLSSTVVDRARRRRHRYMDGEVLDQRTSPHASAPLDAARREAQDSVDSALKSIDPVHERIVRLHHFEGHTLREIARRLKIPEDSARWQLKCAHARLRALLARRYSGDDLEWNAGLAPVGWMLASWKQLQERVAARLGLRRIHAIAGLALVGGTALVASAHFVVQRSAASSDSVVALAPPAPAGPPLAFSGGNLTWEECWEIARRHFAGPALLDLDKHADHTENRTAIAAADDGEDVEDAASLPVVVLGANGLPIEGAIVLYDVRPDGGAQPGAANEKTSPIPADTKQIEPGVYEAVSDEDGMTYFPIHAGDKPGKPVGKLTGNMGDATTRLRSFTAGVDANGTSCLTRGPGHNLGASADRTRDPFLLWIRNAATHTLVEPDEIIINEQRLPRFKWHFNAQHALELERTAEEMWIIVRKRSFVDFVRKLTATEVMTTAMKGLEVPLVPKR